MSDDYWNGYTKDRQVSEFSLLHTAVYLMFGTGEVCSRHPSANKAECTCLGKVVTFSQKSGVTYWRESDGKIKLTTNKTDGSSAKQLIY